MNTVQITRNNDSMLISVDLSKFDRKDIENISNTLMAEFKNRIRIPLATDEEQAEIEALLDSLTEDDRKIAFSETIRISL